MFPEPSLSEQLAAAQEHIRHLSQQLATEREAAQQAQAQWQRQLEQQQHQIAQLSAQVDQAEVCQKTTAISLDDAETLYRALFESIDEGVCLFERLPLRPDGLRDYAYVAMNPAMRSMFGIPDLSGQSVRDHFPGEVEDCYDRYDHVLETGESIRFERELPLQDKVLEIFLSRVEDSAGHRLLAVIQDVTARKRTERNLDFLADLATDLSRLSTAEEIMRTVGAKVGDYLQATLCVFAHIDEAADQATVNYTWHSADKPDAVGGYRLSDFITEAFRQAARAREPIVINDTQQDPRVARDRYVALQIRAYVAVPFHREGRWKYLLTVNDAIPRTWREDEIALIEAVTNRIFPRLERAEAEAAAKDLANRLTLALQLGSYGVSEWDFVNPPVWDQQIYHLYGLQDLGRPVTYQDWHDRLHPDDVNRVEDQLSQAQTGREVIAAEFRICQPDATLRWVQAFAQTQYDAEGHPVRMVSITQDITARKAAEAALQDLTDRLSLALQAGSIGTWDWDCVNEVNWDDQMYVLYGLQNSRERAIYLTWLNSLHPDDRDRADALLKKALRGEAIYDIEFRILRPDGELRWIYAVAQVQRDSQGNPTRMVGINQDITERKQAESELQCLASRLSLALQAGHIGFWLWDLDQDLFWDPSLCRIYGLPETDRITDWQTWRNLVHPEDIDPVEALLQAALQGAPYEGTEFRIYRTDGALRWIQSSAYVQRDEQGQPVHMIGINQDITVRKQAELALKEQSSRLTLALKAGSYGIWEWNLGSDLMWDDQIYQDYGLQDLGRPITYQDWRGAVHPDDLNWVEAQLEADLRASIPFNAELRIRRPDGEVRWVLSTAKLYCDGQGQPLRMVGLHQDITHRKQAEQDIRESRAKFQRLVDDIGDRFVIFSHTGTVMTYVSGGLQAIFGVPPEAVLGKPWATAVNWFPETIELAQAEVQKLLTDRVPSQEFEMAFTRPDGEVRIIHVVQHPVWDEANHLLAIEGLIEDITERKATEVALRRTNAELERATRLKDEFLANMSHELRTPLNAILGMTEGLQEEIFGPLNERQQHSLATIERSGNHLLALINDVLDLAKIEAGQMELDFSAINVSLLCSASVTFVKQQAHKKRQRIETHIPEGLPDLYGDDRRLRQVLINLLTNAVKFTPEGGQITLTASYTTLAPDATTQAGTWIHPQVPPSDTLGLLSLAVSDTGIGISPEDAQKLFQPFTQVNAALNRQHEGTGLGLSLVKRIVNAHGGEVTLASEVGHGSCFTVQIPIIPIPGESSLGADSTASIAASPPTEPAEAPLILLAEDNEASISTTTSYLEAKGYRIIVARNGLESVTLAATAQPDVILMDIQMPHLDGLEAIRQIRQNPALATVPIIALTALAMPIDEERCLAAGANQYLSKPIRLKQLFQRITAALAPVTPPSS